MKSTDFANFHNIVQFVSYYLFAFPKVIVNFQKRCLMLCSYFREGTFFLGGGGLENFGIFFPKKVLALHRVLMKTLLTPYLQVTDKSATLPSLLHGIFHAVETSERFACEPMCLNMDIFISILNVCALKQGKCEQSVWDIYVLQLKFEYGSI